MSPEASKARDHAITFFVNNQAFKTTEHELTGTAIKALAKIPADYELFRVQGNETVPVGTHATIDAVCDDGILLPT